VIDQGGVKPGDLVLTQGSGACRSLPCNSLKMAGAESESPQIGVGCQRLAAL